MFLACSYFSYILVTVCVRSHTVTKTSPSYYDGYVYVYIISMMAMFSGYVLV